MFLSANNIIYSSPTRQLASPRLLCCLYLNVGLHFFGDSDMLFIVHAFPFLVFGMNIMNLMIFNLPVNEQINRETQLGSLEHIKVARKAVEIKVHILLKM